MNKSVGWVLVQIGTVLVEKGNNSLNSHYHSRYGFMAPIAVVNLIWECKINCWTELLNRMQALSCYKRLPSAIQGLLGINRKTVSLLYCPLTSLSLISRKKLQKKSPLSTFPQERGVKLTSEGHCTWASLLLKSIQQRMTRPDVMRFLLDL